MIMYSLNFKTTPKESMKNIWYIVKTPSNTFWPDKRNVLYIVLFLGVQTHCTKLNYRMNRCH